MVSYEDVAAMISTLPETTEGVRYQHRAWSVDGKVFAWERPFSKADLKRFGAQTPPSGEILAISCEDVGEVEAILAAHPKAFFTIEHFAGYPAYLVQLEVVAKKELRAALLDGWLTCAPPELANAYLHQR